MMKKKISLLFLLLITPLPVFLQVNFSAEKLLGDWKVIKFEDKEGEEDDKEIIGSVFHFKPSGVLLADKPATKDDEDDFQKTGSWKVSGNNIILYKESEDPQTDKGTTLNVTRFEGNMLFIYDPKDKVTVIFERIKN